MASQRRAFEFTLLFSVPFVAAFLTVPDVIMRAMFARGAFSKADAAAAGATLAAYAIGLVPFVLIRSAVATFYARKDTATPVKAALTGVAVNVALKIAAGRLAGPGRPGARDRGRRLDQSVAGDRLCGAGRLSRTRPAADAIAGEVRRRRNRAGCALWFAARFATPPLAQLGVLRDELVLLLLVVVGAVVYAGLILLLFGRRWLVSLVR